MGKPRVIDGLGQEAYWMGSSITGALYVLKGDAFLRISIRGGENTSQRHGPTTNESFQADIRNNL